MSKRSLALPLVFIRPVAGKAIVGEQGADVAVEFDFAGGLGLARAGTDLCRDAERQS